MTTPMANRDFVLDARIYHSSFFRSLRSEIRKLTCLRSFWINHIIMIVGYTLIMWAVGATSRSALDAYAGDYSLPISEAVTAGISFIIIFPIVQGVLAVTNEYASNTMRTTTLSDPRRGRAFSAKMLAVGILSGISVGIMTVLSTLVFMVTSGISWNADSNDLRPLVVFWLVLTLAAVMSAGLGYAIRSTAGSIMLALVGLYLSTMVAIINLDWIQDTLIHYMPLNVISTATSSGSFVMTDGSGISWSTATIAWVLYTVVIGALGFIRYSRSDV